MNKDLNLKKCSKCGSLIEILKDCNCNDCGIICCGEPMQDVTINDKDASFEKHIPNYEIKDGYITIKVNHVMDNDHYIEMIMLKTENETYIKTLKPNEIPEIKYPLDSPATIYSYCNKHGLWKVEVK